MAPLSSRIDPVSEDMEISLNGEPRRAPEGASVADLLQLLDLSGRKLAVELNREIVPRSTYAQRLLRPGDRVEIVNAIGGG